MLKVTNSVCFSTALYGKVYYRCRKMLSVHQFVYSREYFLQHCVDLRSTFDSGWERVWVFSFRRLLQDRALSQAGTLNLYAGWVVSGCVHSCSYGHTCRCNLEPVDTVKHQIAKDWLWSQIPCICIFPFGPNDKIRVNILFVSKIPQKFVFQFSSLFSKEKKKMLN